jgi:hypothetical protein
MKNIRVKTKIRASSYAAKFLRAQKKKLNPPLKRKK